MGSGVLSKAQWDWHGTGAPPSALQVRAPGDKTAVKFGMLSAGQATAILRGSLAGCPALCVPPIYPKYVYTPAASGRQLDHRPRPEHGQAQAARRGCRLLSLMSHAVATPSTRGNLEDMDRSEPGWWVALRLESLVVPPREPCGSASNAARRSRGDSRAEVENSRINLASDGPRGLKQEPKALAKGMFGVSHSACQQIL